MSLNYASLICAAALTVVAVSACNSDSSSSRPATDDELMQYLVGSNLRFGMAHDLIRDTDTITQTCLFGSRYRDEWDDETDAFLGYWDREQEILLPPHAELECLSWRWNDDLIPVKTNGSELAERAMDEIERVFNRHVFDRHSIANVPDDEIDAGIIVSMGTSPVPDGADPRAFCANVAVGPNDLSPISNNIWQDDASYEIDFPVFINLGNPDCSPNLNIVIHEFGHAMGLEGHFPGFGMGGAISNNFWLVLFSLYNNPPGTREQDLLLHRPFGF
ncbi:hypothetical protein CAI21_10245 [Alkalilimnicola ehrlichii]|uniref:Peptidase M10 metallopeptidase domain-containing protein n=1 Tax=Alkalilimnicola ehrlichii TaxID=351052 RepID=A0A3E0WSV7_9GAMM|nr:hypothetical protein [Alkalilimnicola ehrlichii]RFA29143.1 hypothetical protein CAI21_10245 [Alkalilimnicola ehrlichii]RFA36054.1 hypothetical protein CAL65_11390 [Alkalilimnicola ehrlichii]